MAEMLGAQLIYAYNLLRAVFDLDFVRPDLYYGSKHMHKFHEIHSMRDIAWSPDMAYSDEINGVYVPELTAQRDPEHIIYCFLHELGHAFIEQTNLEMSTNAMTLMFKKNRRRVYLLEAVCEGLADYMAIVCCEKSNDAKLIEEGRDRRVSLEKQLTEWVAGQEFRMLASIYEIKCDTSNWWKEVLFEYLSREPIRLKCHKYMVGHHFISNLRSPDVKKIISKPPKTIEEMVFREEYGE